MPVLVQLIWIFGLATLTVSHAQAMQLVEAAQPTSLSTSSADSSMNTVVVTGRRPDVVQKVNSTVYNVGNNLQNATSTAQEILYGLPYINVNSQGEVILRGEKGAVVTINGNIVPLQSALLLPGAVIDSIEVVANPTAISGSSVGALINITLKPNPNKPISGDFNIQTDTLNDWTIGVTTNLRHRNLRLTSIISFSTDNSQKSSEYLQSTFLDDTLGAFTTETRNKLSILSSEEFNAQTRVNVSLPNQRNINMVWYHFGANRASQGNGESLFQLNRNDISDKNYTLSETSKIISDSNVYAISLSKSTPRDSRSERLDPEFRTGYSLSAMDSNYRINNSWHSFPSSSLNVGQNNVSDRIDVRGSQTFSSGFSSNLRNQAKLKLKFAASHKLSQTINRFSDLATANTRRENIFKFREIQYSTAATLEKTSGDFSILGGLGIENNHYQLAANDVIFDTINNYSQVIPSIHILYELNDNVSLKSSYSRRTSPYSHLQLNPALIYTSPETARQGNPNLRPAKIDSFDAEITFALSQHALNFTGFYKDRQNEVSSYYVVNGQGLIVESYANIGHSTRCGFGAAFRNTQNRKFNYSLEFMGIVTRISAIPLINSPSDNFFEQTSKIIFGYKPDNKSSLSLQLDYTGPTYGIDWKESERTDLRFTATHILRNGWTASLDYFDVIGSPHREIFRENSTLSSYSRTTNGDRSIRLSLARQF